MMLSRLQANKVVGAKRIGLEMVCITCLDGNANSRHIITSHAAV